MLMTNQLIGFGAGGVAGDPFTKILLHFDGTDTSTTITDDNTGGSAHTWTAVGNAQLDNGIAPQFGSAALLCDGTGDYVETPDHADFTLGSGPWTIDFWYNLATAGNGTNRYLFGQSNSAGEGISLAGLLTSANKWTVELGDASGNSAFATVVGTSAFTTAGWRHFEVCRTGNVIKMFIGGTQEGGDVAYSVSSFNSVSKFSVGRNGEATTLNWRGSIDEFRLSVGIARHTSNFTPPTSPY